MHLRGWAGVLLAIAFLVGACSSGEDDADIDVVVTTTILGDIARNVTGDEATVEVLMPVGVDPHDFRASSRQVAAIGAADLVVANGLQLEEGIEDVLQAAEADGVRLIGVGELVDPQPFATAGEDGLDPHVWMDPQRVADIAGIIATELEAIAPDGGWTQRAEMYGAEMIELDDEIRQTLSPIGNRVLVTNHDSLGYFAGRYDFEIVGVIIPGGSTLAEPSPADLADIVAAVEEHDVAAIFADTTLPTTLADAVAAEVGRDIGVVELYTGSLDEPGSEADTLAGMLRTNSLRIAEALGQ